MEIINYNELDFSEFNKLSVYSSESDIYTDKDKKHVYKIFKTDLAIYELTLKSEKLKLLENKKMMNSIVVPSAKIVGRSLVGIREDYIDGVDLCDAKESYTDKQLLSVLLNISKDLEQMHKDKIIVSDLNFGNIRLDKKMNHHFLDVLSYSIDKIPPNAISYILSEYLKKHKKNISPSKNTDKISYLMLAIQLFTDKCFFDITDYDFDKKAEQIKDLELLREIYEDLRSYYVKDVPYLHELIRG